MSNVLGVSEPKPWSSGDGVTYWVTLDDRTEDVPCYSDQAAALKIHEPLPEGWELGKSSKGKDKLTPPKSAGGGKKPYTPRFTDTEAGWRLNDERVDRRAALEKATAFFDKNLDDEDLLAMAGRMYAWLRQTSGVAVATVSDNGEAQTSPSNSPAPVGVLDSSSGQPGTPSGGVGPDGEAGSASSATHEHQWVPSPKLKSFDICVVPDCYETRKRVKTDA
jgi:hypothetical protein